MKGCDFYFHLYKVFLGDFNGDRNLDLLCKNFETGQGRTVALADGSAGFRVQKLLIHFAKLSPVTRTHSVKFKFSFFYQN